MGVGSTYNRRTFQLLRLCSRPGLYLLPPHSGPVSPALGRYPGARHQKRHQILIHWRLTWGRGGGALSVWPLGSLLGRVSSVPLLGYPCDGELITSPGSLTYRPTLTPNPGPAPRTPFRRFEGVVPLPVLLHHPLLAFPWPA